MYSFALSLIVGIAFLSASAHAETTLTLNNPEQIKAFISQIEQLEVLAEKTITSDFSWEVGEKFERNLEKIQATKALFEEALVESKTKTLSADKVEDLEEALWNNARNASIIENKLKSVSVNDFAEVDVKALKQLYKSLDQLQDAI